VHEVWIFQNSGVFFSPRHVSSSREHVVRPVSPRPLRALHSVQQVRGFLTRVISSMSRPWNPSIYRTHDAQTSPPGPGIIGSLMQAVDDCSQQLRRQPYDPESWLRRASSFLDLNYPELATSDAYKASLLLDQEPSALRGVDINSTRSKIHDILGQALYDCHCHWELADFWEAVSTRFPSSHANDKVTSIKALLSRKNKAAATLGGTPQEQRDRIRDGGVGTVDYPWTEDRHLVRSRELIDIVNEELTHGTENKTCFLGQSSLSPDGDMLGMYAARDIQLPEHVAVSKAAHATIAMVESMASPSTILVVQ
jgi:hypothetical protein